MSRDEKENKLQKERSKLKEIKSWSQNEGANARKRTSQRKMSWDTTLSQGISSQSKREKGTENVVPHDILRRAPRKFSYLTERRDERTMSFYTTFQPLLHDILRTEIRNHATNSTLHDILSGEIRSTRHSAQKIYIYVIKSRVLIIQKSIGEYGDADTRGEERTNEFFFFFSFPKFNYEFHWVCNCFRLQHELIFFSRAKM